MLLILKTEQISPAVLQVVHGIYTYVRTHTHTHTFLSYEKGYIFS